MKPSPITPENASSFSPVQRRDAILSAIAYAGQQFLRSDDWQASIDAVLERLGQATAAERVYVFEDHTAAAGKPVASLRYEWVTPSSSGLLAHTGAQNVPYLTNSTAHWRTHLQAGKIVTGKIDESSPAMRRVLDLLLVRSFVAVPVFTAGKWWGAIGFADSQSSRDWSDSELDALQVAASLLGAAFERQQIAQERAESVRFWSLMSRLSAAGLDAVDESTLLNTTVEQLGAIIRADHCFVMSRDAVSESIAVTAGTPRVAQLLAAFSEADPPHAIMNVLLRERRTLVFDDLRLVKGKYSPITNRIPIASGIAAPMIVQNQVLGAVLLGFDALHPFTAVERERVELATQQLARFLFNARLLTAETLARKQAETLQAVGQIIGSTLNLREVLERILSELERVVPCDSASVQRLESDRSVVIAGRGFGDPGQRVGLAFAIDDPSLPNKAIYEDQRSVILPDVMASHGRFGAVAEESDYIHSWLGVPLVFAGQTIGMLTLDKKAPGFYTAQHASLAEAFAAQAAIALENARLFEVTRQLNALVWRQAEQLRQVINTVADGIVLLDAHHAIVLANNTFYDYLPSLAGEVRPASLDQICGRPLEWFLDQTGGIGWRDAPAIDGTRRIFAISANKVNIGPDAGGLVLSISDVTVERERREERRSQERLATIGAMASGIAHDFNNILQGIIGFADLLSKNPEIPAAARQRLALMANEGQRGAGLIRLISEYSREVPIVTRPVDLEALISKAASSWETRLQRPVLVSIEHDEALWAVSGDEVRLRETLTTMVDDAALTLPESHPIAIRLANRADMPENSDRGAAGRPGRWVTVEISGGSQWFASTEQVHALQYDLPLMHVPAGRDVMLAQVQGVVRQHRGVITVTSQPDGGCAVTIVLPAAASRETD